ncbi:hypothetical protein [Granulicella sp. S156]|uniref:hypothetical protein n=1 Tax=Granulicella sp. S156 TaxID=1747224 RepID=UPI00131A6C6F|nr:hypothetical protein [Granulicella sp. S156]
MKMPLRNFDMQGLYAALDAARRAQELSWAALVSEINKPFEGTPSIPISLSTVRGMQDKRSVTSAVVLQILRWMGRAPESFLSEIDTPSQPSELLPEPGPARILRFDTRAMHAALDAERLKRGMKWKQVADELPGFSESMLTNLATGPLIGFPRVMMIPQWLGRPAASFVRAHSR